MSRNRTIAGYLASFLIGALIAFAVPLEPAPLQTRTTIIISDLSAENHTVSFSFMGVGTHTSPDIRGLKVFCLVTAVDAPEEPEPIDVNEAIDWAFFALLALLCLVLALFIAGVLASFVGVVVVEYLTSSKKGSS